VSPPSVDMSQLVLHGRTPVNKTAWRFID